MTSRRSAGEGSIYQRAGREGWTAQIALPGGKYRTRSAATKRGAQLLLAEMRREAERQVVAPARLTVAAYLAEWAERTADRRTARTQDKVLTHIAVHLAPALGSLLLARVEAGDIQRLQRDLLGRRSPSTVHGVLSTLRAALADAVRWRYRDRSPFESVSVIPGQPAAVEPLPPAQARAILAAFAGHRYEPAVTLALTLGLRQGEILGLRWSDLDFAGNVLHVTGALKRIPKAMRAAGDGAVERGPAKTPKSHRSVPLPAITRRVLLAHRAAQRERGDLTAADWVNVTDERRPVQQAVLSQSYQRQLRAAGLPPVPFRNLRHGAASLLLAEGVPVSVVVDVLGHSTSKLALSIYSRMPSEALRAGIAAMDRVFGAETASETDSAEESAG